MLVVGVRVHRGHEALLKAEGVIQNFGQDGETIRRARRVGDDEVLRRVERVLVDAQDERCIHVFCRSRDDHTTCAGTQVGVGLVPARELASALEHDVNAKLTPGQGRDVSLHQHRDGPGAHHHLVVLEGHRLGKTAVH
jgi:hypothetical protein